MNKREITTHKINGLNEALDIAVLDEPGHGGACHRYVIYAPNDVCNQELNASVSVEINFQNGPIAEHGVNGVSNEALLAVLIDRLKGFQSGRFAHGTNAAALRHLEQAMFEFHQRTIDRINRGVEGTSKL